MARKIKSRAFQRKDSYFGMYGVSRKAIKKKREEAKNTVEKRKTNEEFEKEYEAFIAKLKSDQLQIVE